MKKPLKILITGPVPPPAGGISIHIWRLKYLLEDEFEIDFIDEASSRKKGVYNMRSLNILAYVKKVYNSDILFIHSGNKLFKKIHILTARLFSKKIIITIHGYGKKRKMPFRAIDSIIFSLANKIILVNADIFSKLSLPLNKCIVKHAFLPPAMEHETLLPQVICEWINKARAQHKVIACANASRLKMHNGQDLYGLDMCIELTRDLVEKKLPISFIYTVSDIEKAKDIFDKNLQLINDLKLKDHFLLISERLSFVKLIEQSDVVIRPTNTDGDALTIREAIFLGKIALASDVVERPAETRLFITRDINDLESKVEEIIGEITSPTISTAERKMIDTVDFRRFYTELINNVVMN